MITSNNALNPPDSELIQSQNTIENLSRKKLWVWRLLIFILPVLVIGGAIAAFMAMSALKPKPEVKEDVIKAIPVLTAKAVQDNVTLKVNAQGEVQPRTQINIVPQVSGLITYMAPKFIEGGKFDKGDLLIRIEPTEFELRVVQARANVAQAETVIMRETSESHIARQDWEDLGRSGQPTALTLREPQMAVGTRLGEVYAADVMDVRLPMTNEDLRRAGLTLGYESSRNSPGISVTLSADVAGVYCEWEGRIVRTDSRFDSETRVLFAYVEVLDPFGKGASNGIPLAPGIYVNAAIDGMTIENSIVVPRSALRGEDQVYIANADDTLSIKTVSVMSSDRNTAILSGGINIGETVITSPIRGVADGMKIAVVSPTTLEKDDIVAGETP